MRILVTGASGFVGSHLGIYLEESGHEVLGISYQSKLELPFPSRRIDLRDRDLVSSTFASFSPDVVIHAAALSKVLDCEDNPKLAHDVNVEATRNVAYWCSANGIKIVFVSTDQVFSGDTGFYRETDPPSPSHVYGETKTEAERIVLNASPQNLVVRSNSVVGRSLGRGAGFTDWIASSVREQKQVTLFHDQFRSPIHVRTLSKILLKCCESDWSGYLHAGGPERLSRLDTGYALARAYRLDYEFMISDSYLNHKRNSTLHRDGSFDVTNLHSLIPDVSRETIESELAKDMILTELTS